MKPTPATTHKKSSAEKEVKEKHLSRFENLLMQIPVAIVVFRGNNYMVELANERALGIIVKEKSFIGKLFFESMPQLESQIKPIFDNVMQSGIAFNGEEYEITLFRNGKNEQAFFNVVYEPIREEDKTISGIIAAATEVTYEVNARKKIEESEAFKRSVLESSPDCVKVLDAEGRLQFMNVNGLCTMEIDDFSVFKNKTWKEFWGEENKHLVNGAIDKALAGNTASFQAFCPTAKGTPKWWDVIVSPVLSPDSNKINSLISVSRDMTEQMNAQKKIEESEAKYRHLFERMDQGFCIIEVIFDESNKGVDYRFLEINPVFENQTGLNNALGKTMKEMVPDLEDKWPEIYGKVVMTGIPSKFVDESESINRWFEVNAFRIGKAQDNKVAIIFSDVSERKTKEKLIQQSEQKISAILENAPFPIGVYVGKEMIVEHANQSFIDIWGKGNDVIGKSFKEILPELDSQLVFEQIQKVLTTGESFHSKNTPIDLIIDGNLRTQYFSYSFTPLYDINGNVYAVMNTAAEVTELNMAQKRLVESDKRFRNTMKQAPVGITILRGPEYIVEMANDAYLQIVDKKESEFVGISIFTSLPEIEESVHTLLNNVVHNAVPYHGSEVPVPLNRFGKQDVGYFDFIWHPLKEEDGKVSGVLAVVTDVTEKVETRKIIEASEKQFNTLANNIQNLAWIANGAGHIYWYNQRWYDYTATTLEEMKGQGWEKVHHPEHVDRVVDFIKQAWQVNQPFELTFPLRGANGEYRWFLTRAFPVCDEEGKISNWIGTNTDITDQKSFTEQLEIKVEERTAELYNKNEELEKMNKELESFAYISSHDLQEPLRKIQTFVSRILDKEENNLSDDGKDMFKRMRNSAERMQTLIQDLLAYSRIKTEERKFEKTDLNKIIAEVREDLKEELKDKHATIEATELCEAHIIPFQFRQLLHNLIGNSLKFSNPQYPPHIKIECEVAKGIKFKNEKLSPQKKYCHISVSDNGIGFEQQYSEKIFEVFQYLHGKNEYNGTGIGLAIVKKIVENHNGIITANGELNKGATFEIYIPAT